MKHQFRSIALVLILISACAPQTGDVTPLTQTSIPLTVSTSTFTSQPANEIEPTGTPRITRTPNLTNTPRSLPSATPMPSATPTFDAASVVTRTPSPPEQCPKRTNVTLPDLSKNLENIEYTFSSKEMLVLEYLNAGGDPSNLIASLRQTWKRPEIFTRNEVVKDLTGDGVPEILVIPSELFIFGCRESQYQVLLSRFSEAALFNSTAQQLVGIQDMNLNEIPEVVIAEFGCGGFGAGQCLDVYVYEWDGKNFKSLIQEQDEYSVGASMIGGKLSEHLPDAQIQDTDGNGTFELILVGDIPNQWYLEYFSNYPWRDRIDTYEWNGQDFVYDRTEFSTPTYRYQAAQDGDSAILNGEYEKALIFYQDVIFSDKLLSWSLAHREHYTSLHQYTWDPAYGG